MPLVLYTRCQPFPRIKGGTCTPAVASGKRVRAAFTQTYWYSTAAELTFSAPWSANHFLPYTERKRLTLSTLGLGFALGLPVIRCFCFVHSDPQPQPALRQHKVFRGSCRGRHDVSVVASPTIRSGISRDAPYTPREPPTHAS